MFLKHLSAGVYFVLLDEDSVSVSVDLRTRDVELRGVDLEELNGLAISVETDHIFESFLGAIGMFEPIFNDLHFVEVVIHN